MSNLKICDACGVEIEGEHRIPVPPKFAHGKRGVYLDYYVAMKDERPVDIDLCVKCVQRLLFGEKKGA